MVKFYKSILIAVLSIIAMTVNAINVTFDIDNPERVSLTVNGTEQALTAGENVLDVAEYSQVTVQAKAGALLKQVHRMPDDTDEYINGMTSCSITVSSYYADKTWTVTSVAESEVRTASCKVTVDDASLVRMQRSGTYSTVTLQDGENVVIFDPTTETQLMIASTNYSLPLYQVTLNGEPIQSQYNTWYVTLSEGAEIDIKANYPDIPVAVHFVYADEESKEFITGVTVNQEAVENYNDDDFTVKTGSLLSITGNTTDFKLDEFKVNGTQVSYFYSPYNVTITDETTIEVKAHKYATISATLNIDNPDNIIVYRGYSYQNDRISGLTAGANTIELSETSTMISILPASGCYITSLTDGAGNTYNADYSGSYNVTLTDGMELNIVSGAISRDKQAVVYIDDRSLANQYFSFIRADRSAVELTTGYNTVNFYDGDNDFGLSWYGDPAPLKNVLQNDETVNPLYENSTSYQLTLTDGDVVKIFFASNPKTYNVNVDVEEGIDVSVKKDIISNVADYTNGFTALQETRVDLTATSEDEITVSVNGETIEAADGVYTFTVSADTEVKVAKAKKAEPVERQVKMWIEGMEELGYWNETVTDNGDGTYTFDNLMESDMALTVSVDADNNIGISTSKGQTEYNWNTDGDTYIWCRTYEYFYFYPHGKDAGVYVTEVDMWASPADHVSYYQEAEDVKDSYFTINLPQMVVSGNPNTIRNKELRFRFWADDEEPGSCLPVKRQVKMWIEGEEDALGYWNEDVTDNGDGTYTFDNLMESDMALTVSVDADNNIGISTSKGQTEYNWNTDGDTYIWCRTYEYFYFYPHGKDAGVYVTEVDMWASPADHVSYYQEAEDVKDSYFTINLQHLVVSGNPDTIRNKELRFRFWADDEEPGSYQPGGDGISNVTSAKAGNSVAYNLQGVKVADNADNLPAGVYIVNGKKVVIRK